MLLEEDPAVARRIAREFISLYLTMPSYTGAWDRAGLGSQEQAEGGSDRLVDAVVAWGGPRGSAPTWMPAPTTSASRSLTPTPTACR